MVEAKSRKFYDELRRYNYVTPTSYLELLGTFIRLLGAKRSEIVEGRRRLEVGLQKLLSTAAQVRGACAAWTTGSGLGLGVLPAPVPALERWRSRRRLR